MVMDNKGDKHETISEAIKRRRHEANLGRKHTEESKQKMREAKKNVSAETRKKLSDAVHNISDETRRRKSEANKGRIVSEETRKKLSSRVVSDETRLKMSRTRKGRPLKEETKRKMSLSRKGRITSKETKSLLSDKACKRLTSGEPFQIKGQFFSIKADGYVGYRSKSIELLIMQVLEASNNVLSWEYEYCAIEYETDEGIRYTVPDFLVCCLDGSVICIEGKGDHLMSGYLGGGKYTATLRWCSENKYQFQLVTESDLESGWII